MTIYEITGAYKYLFGRLEEETEPEEAAKIWDEIESTEFSLVEKSEAYARVIQNYKAEIEGLKGEIDRLTEMKKAKETAIERMKSHLLEAFSAADIGKVKTQIGTFSVAQNPYSVVILDETEIPREYCIPQPDKIDKQAIKRRFEETGEIIPGTEMKRGMSLRFK